MSNVMAMNETLLGYTTRTENMSSPTTTTTTTTTILSVLSAPEDIGGGVQDSINATDYFRDVFVLTLYLVTSVIAVVGNTFICVVIKQKRWLKSTTYVLIFSMAISDIMGGAVILGQWLFCSSWVLDGGGKFGEFLCGILKTGQMLSYYVSSLTMLAIAYDRYRLVCRPLAKRVKVAYLLVPCWLLGFVFISGNFFSMRVSEYFSPTQGLITCRVVFQTSVGYMFRKIRVMFLITTQYLIPLGLTAYLYLRVMGTIWSREQMTGTKSEDKQQQFDEKKKRTILMLIVVTALFALSYIPTHVYHFLMFYTNAIPLVKGTCYSTAAYMLGYWLGISSCAYNPFIYCYFNSEFKREAQRWWLMVKTGGRERTLPASVPQSSGLAPSSADSVGTENTTDHQHHVVVQQSTQV